MKKLYFSLFSLFLSVNIFSQCAFTLSVTPVDVSCYGLCDGSASVTITGGTGPYTYTWNPGGASTTTISGLCPGTFKCIIEEAGCKDSVSFSIAEPNPIVFTPTPSNILCYGVCTGSVSSIASGGTPPYVFTVSGGSSTSLCAGNYVAYVTDDNGCIDSTNISITQPSAPLSVTVTSTDVTCYGTSNGTGSATVSGGTSSYNYSWSTTPVETAPNVFNLPTGTTTIVVTDLAGCTDTATVTINEPPQIIINTISTTSVSCYGGNDGTASMSASGGIPSVLNGYTYLWSVGSQTTTSATGLSAGTHSFSVTDSLSCTVTKTVTIVEPNPFTANASQTNLCGSATGDVTVNVTGGTASFTYSWSAGGQTTQSITGLTAGTYTVLVTDANLCTATDTVQVLILPVISTTLSTTNIKCLGDTNGTASIAVSGGSPGFTYSWSNGETTNSISGLTSGNYTITVTDTIGCVSTNTFVIGGATLLSVNVSATHICSSGTGTATLTATGGTPGYQYSWNTGDTIPVLTNLSAGTYTCMVTDSSGCIDTNIIKIRASADLAVMTTITPIVCLGDSNAIVTLTGAAGLPPYTFSWAPGGSTATTITGLGPGTYTANITDSVGCIANQIVNITAPTAVTATLTGVNATCFGCADGSATASVSGGNGVYNYSWSPISATTSSVTGLTAGNYTVCVSDSSGCGDTCMVITITEPPSGIFNTDVSAKLLSANPVPFGNVLNLKIENKKSGNIIITLNNIIGDVMYKEISSDKIYNRSIDTSSLPAGVYIISVQDSERIIITRKIIKTNN